MRLLSQCRAIVSDRSGTRLWNPGNPSVQFARSFPNNCSIQKNDIGMIAAGIDPNLIGVAHVGTGAVATNYDCSLRD